MMDKWLVKKQKIETDENEPSTSVRKKRQESMIQST